MSLYVDPKSRSFGLSVDNYVKGTCGLNNTLHLTRNTISLFTRKSLHNPLQGHSAVKVNSEVNLARYKKSAYSQQPLILLKGIIPPKMKIQS